MSQQEDRSAARTVEETRAFKEDEETARILAGDVGEDKAFPPDLFDVCARLDAIETRLVEIFGTDNITTVAIAQRLTKIDEGIARLAPIAEVAEKLAGLVADGEFTLPKLIGMLRS